MLLLFAGAVFAQPARIQKHRNAIPGRYMVLLNTNVAAEAYDGVVKSLAATYGLNITQRWEDTPRGFICDGATEAAIVRLANDPRVRLIEEDFTFVLSGMQWTVWNSQYLWNLDRIDEPTYFVNDSQYDMCPEGRPVVAYMLDIGVRADHEQFNLGEPTRVVDSRRFDGVNGLADTTNGCAANANLWHGTATASVLAGTTVGSAKTRVVSLRFLDCNGRGTGANIVNAVRWIRSANDPWRNEAAVVNYSGGIGSWDGEFANMNAAVTDLVNNTQIPFFTSAENFAGDACMFSPNNLAYTNVNRNGVVFTVGGTSLGGNGDRNDYRLQFWDGSQPRIGQEGGSNGGRCVSIYAPAMDIYAARNSSTTAYGLAAGTSFASPLTAGVAARYMEQSGVRDYRNVFNYLLNAAASTGTVVNNSATVEYWLCTPASGFTVPQYHTSRTPITTCPTGYNNPPVHVPATTNTSNAGMLYSDMTCP